MKYASGLAPNNAKRIIDKMPFNFLRVGLIKMALPDARIIYCQRNPMDTGLSNFRQLFKENVIFAYNQEFLGAVLKAHLNIMQHWIELFGDDIYVSSYEDLVQNPADATRRLIDYCGLEWDDACLSPHKAERGVKTASVAQVRAPINTKSVEGWRKFEKQLAPMAAALQK